MKPVNDKINAINMETNNHEGELYSVPIRFGLNKETATITPQDQQTQEVDLHVTPKATWKKNSEAHS